MSYDVTPRYARETFPKNRLDALLKKTPRRNMLALRHFR
jgi:hypothetical protein